MTAAPDPIIRKYHFDNLHMPFSNLLLWLEDDKLNLDGPYQRGLVWGEARKVRLIESMLGNRVIPGIIINDRGYPEFMYVVDGKQRLSAILEFVRDGYAVPAWWWETVMLGEGVDRSDPEAVVRYSQLSEQGQAEILQRPLPVHISKYRGSEALERETELFDVFNFGGVAQGDSDLD